MIISNHIYSDIDSILLRLFQSNLINFLLLIKVDLTASCSCQREFLIEQHRNSICKFRIRVDRKNFINFLDRYYFAADKIEIKFDWDYFNQI